MTRHAAFAKSHPPAPDWRSTEPCPDCGRPRQDHYAWEPVPEPVASSGSHPAALETADWMIAGYIPCQPQAGLAPALEAVRSEIA